jgi:hypothetical protein
MIEDPVEGTAYVGGRPDGDEGGSRHPECLTGTATATG